MMGSTRIHTKHGAVSANKLLERPPGEEYILEWTTLLAKEAGAGRELNERALLLFRLEDEWLGILAKYLFEVCEERPIHRIPHRVNPILKGLVNLKGQLRVTVSLKDLLQIGKSTVERKEDALKYKRMLSIQKDNDIWMFPVDEVYGIHHIDIHEIENVPVTVSKSSVNFLRGVIPWQDINISYLDEELLFPSLRRSVL